MNEFDANPIHDRETDRGAGSGLSFSVRYRSVIVDNAARLTELELENSRLHRLVAELLMKNQQLRKAD